MQEGHRYPVFEAVEARLEVLRPGAAVRAIKQFFVQAIGGIEEKVFGWKELRARAERQAQVIVRHNAALESDPGMSVHRGTHFAVRLEPARSLDEIAVPEHPGTANSSNTPTLIT